MAGGQGLFPGEAPAQLSRLGSEAEMVLECWACEHCELDGILSGVRGVGGIDTCVCKWRCVCRALCCRRG